jgi:DNA-binding transcriptional ArsR family regulator
MESAAKDQDPALLYLRLAYALGHPLRARIASELHRQPRSPDELAKALGVPLPRVAYHCDVLELHGGIAPPSSNGNR